MTWVKRAAIAAVALPIVAVPLCLGTVRADAATGTMAGLFGFEVKFATVTASGSPLCPCEKISYDAWPGDFGTANGTAALNTWISTTPEQKTVLAYSKGTEAALRWIRENPGDPNIHTVQFVLLGSPETPRSGSPQGLPPGTYDNVIFVVRQYDITADSPTNKFNLLAVFNASLSTHLRGYDDLDLDNPDAVYVDPTTGIKTLYYRTDVLPMLALIDWLVNDEQMAQLDGIFRPLIEAAYDRPVQIPDNPDPLAPEAATMTLTPTTEVPPVISAASERMSSTEEVDQTKSASQDADRTVTVIAPAASESQSESAPQDAVDKVAQPASPDVELAADQRQPAGSQVVKTAAPPDRAADGSETAASATPETAASATPETAASATPETAADKTARPARHRAPSKGANTHSAVPPRDGTDSRKTSSTRPGHRAPPNRTKPTRTPSVQTGSRTGAADADADSGTDKPADK